MTFIKVTALTIGLTLIWVSGFGIGFKYANDSCKQETVKDK